MLLLIVIFIGSFCLTFSICMLVWYAWRRVHEKRHTVDFANRSVDDLFLEATLWPQYRYDYSNYRICVGDETAKKIIVNRYLIDRGLIGYRKERIEL